MVRLLSSIARNIALAALCFMTIFITVAVVARALGMPIVGDIELIEFTMVVLIMFTFEYAESLKGHIAIEILLDRIPHRGRLLFEFVGKILTILVTSVMVAAIIIKSAGDLPASELLRIPFLPFKYIMAIGLFLWALRALLNATKILKDFINISKNAGE